MELAAHTAEIYVRYAITQMHDVVDRLDDERVNVRPFGPATNSVAALIVHSCGVGVFWSWRVLTAASPLEGPEQSLAPEY